jgi:ATPases involved in chromosome partitioning
MKKAKIYTITSIKGGSGKTTTLLNLAAMYSLTNKRVLIIDLDLAAGDVAPRLNVEFDKDIYHCYEDIKSHTFNQIEDYLYSYSERIDVIPAPKDPRYASKIEPSFLTYLLSKVTLKYDIILIDTNHLLTGINLLMFDYSDKILYVINNDSMNLRGMRTMTSIFEDMESDKLGVILNDANSLHSGYYSLSDIKNIIKNGIDFRIPQSFYQKKYDKYVLNGDIFLLDSKIRKKCKRATRIFETMADSLIRED